MISICKFADVSEHDMDMLIMEEFICDERFRKIFLDKINVNECVVGKAYHSLSDSNGESDITFVVDVDGIKCGILVEDKIDAPTMTRQSERYYVRGNEGTKQGEYDKFYVFLVCPEEYWQEHKEDKNAQYEYIVFYEELRNYLASRKDIRSQYKLNIIEQAISNKKKGYQLVENNNVTNFWRNMQKFCEDKFPSLYMNYDGGPKGSSSSWIYFKTPVEKIWVVYKSDSGRIMLEYYGANAELLKKKLEACMEEDMEFCKVGKSFGVLLHKARWKISLKNDFNDVVDIVTEVLEQVTRLVELVKKVELFSNSK